MDNKEKNKNSIYDPIRGRWVACTPEERVRQAFVAFLIEKRSYPAELIANEQSITVGQLHRRCDTVVYDTQLHPLMIIEYKNPHIPLTQAVVEQAFRYNSTLRVPIIVISNGIDTFVFRVGYNGSETSMLPTLPHYHDLVDIYSDSML